MMEIVVTMNISSDILISWFALDEWIKSENLQQMTIFKCSIFWMILTFFHEIISFKAIQLVFL